MIKKLFSLAVFLILLFLITPEVWATISYGPGTVQCGNAQNACQAAIDDSFNTDPGSCAETACGGESPDGCFCDAQCQSFGDCCADVCDFCTEELSFCFKNKGDRVSACAEAANPFLDSYVINEECHSCIVSAVASPKKAGTNCGTPFGACCFATGNCELLRETECASAGGTYSGDGTTCEPNLCPQPSCEGFCGPSNGPPGGGCFCDELCFSIGDCCEDVCDWCSELSGCNGDDDDDDAT